MPQSGPHVLHFPYYSTKGDWDSVLTLNNGTHSPLTASLTIYSLDGTALFLPDVLLQADTHATLRLSALIAHVETRGSFQEGSVEVRFSGAPMDLGARLTVSDVKHGLSFDMERPMMLTSSTLEGLWWSLDTKTSGQVMLSNTTSQNLNVKENVEWRGRSIPAHAISLSAHQTVVLNLEDLLEELDIKANGIESGGLSIAHNGPPGALIAHGVIQNKEKHFASNLDFIDPAAQASSTLNGTGLMLGRPASTAVFSSGSFFVPHLALRNALATPQTASVTVQYTVGGSACSQTLPVFDLAAHEVRSVDFSAFLNSLGGISIDDAGAKIESTGPTGSLIAQLVSIDQKTSMSVGVPLLAVGPTFVGTGAHPFHLDGDYQAVVHLKNLAAEITTAIVQIRYDGGEFSPELVRLEPGQSVSIDVRRLRDSRAKDVHGHQIPIDVTSGQVQWFQHGKQKVIGRLVASNAPLGVSASFACGGDCCPPSFQSVSIDPGLLEGVPEDTFALTVMETDESCGQFYGPYNITAYATVSSTDPSVADVSGSSTEMVDEGECTINVNFLATSFTHPPPGDCDLGGCESNCTEAETEMTEPIQTRVRTPHHLVVVTDELQHICSSVKRVITFQIVDRNGNRVVGVVPVKEKFTSISSNTCGNGQPEEIGCSSMNATAGILTDRISIGCNSVGGSCGYDITKQYQWCPSRRAPVPIGTYSGYTHSDAVSINGNVMPPDSMAPNTVINP